MDDILVEMIAHYRITQVIADYCRGCDRLDEARMAGVYADDSWDDHGLSKMPGPDYTRLSMASRRGMDDSLSHHLGQTVIDLQGEKAGAETYFIATIARLDEDGRPCHHQMGGRYVDELVQENGQWRIKKRITIRDWSTTNPVLKDWIGERNFVPGRTDAQDLSYAVLRQRHSG